MINPFVTYNNNFLYYGEQMVPVNPYTNYGYTISPFYFVTNFGRYFSIYNGALKELAQTYDPTGYYSVKLCTDSGMKHVYSHRGVLASFAPHPDMYQLQVDHIDGNHFNNNVANLRWATRQQNVQYAVDNGITPKRSRVISDNDIIVIMNLARDGKSDEDICDIMSHIKIAPETVRIIRTGQAIYGDILKRLGIEPIFKRIRTDITEEDCDRVKALANMDLRSKAISELTGISDRSVRRILQREREGNVTLPKNCKNPFIQVPDKYKDLDIRLVNIHTSPLHTIQPLYGVSRDGRMFSMARGSWVEMTIGTNRKGYAVLGLLTDHGNKQFFVHRLVMSTFNPVPNMYDLEVNHRNGVHNDSRLENLEWVTHIENMQHAADTIIEHTPQRAPDEDVKRVIELANEGNSDEQIAVLMDNKYTPNNIKIIRTGLKSYGPVLKQLNLKPYKYHKAGLNPNEREALYEYIESRLGTKGLMQLYIDAGEKFELSPESVRGIYSQERAKRKS